MLIFMRFWRLAVQIVVRTADVVPPLEATMACWRHVGGMLEAMVLPLLEVLQGMAHSRPMQPNNRAARSTD